LGVAWNKAVGSIVEVDLISNGQGGLGGFIFYNVTSSTVCYLLAQLKNTGYFICNGLQSLNCDTGNLTSQTTNINNLQVQNLTIGNSIIGRLSSVYMSSKPTNNYTDLLFSNIVKNQAVSTVFIKHSNDWQYFAFDQTTYTVGQTIYFFVESTTSFIDISGELYNTTAKPNQIFYIGGYWCGKIRLFASCSLQLIYMGNNRWVGMYCTSQLETTQSNILSGSYFINNSTSYPTIPTYPTIVY